MADSPENSETPDTEDSRLRMRRRAFVGTGLAAAGAALVPAAGTAAARKAPAGEAEGGATAKANGARQASAPTGTPSTSTRISQLPSREAYPNLPAVPVDPAGVADTLGRLEIREQQELQAKQGLTRKYTIGGTTRRAYAFLFEEEVPASRSESRDALADAMRDDPDGAPDYIQRNLDRQTGGGPAGATATPLSLEQPEQFSISWTTFPDVYSDGQPFLSEWASSLTDADAATEQFWPMIAQHGFGYNLIIPERVSGERADELRARFGSGWTREVRSALRAGNLYAIDLSLFESLQSQEVNGAPRFTPASITLLIRNTRTKSLRPVSIIVSGNGGSGQQTYTRGSASDSAWLYALQAVKAGVTLFGVWLGHVYHWHIVTAAMQMTMFNTLPTDHPVYQLLAPQSKFAIPFDDALLNLWSDISPPTSLATANDFLGLANEYAAGRSFFDDDPKTTLKQLGLRQKDFTSRTAWDRYPVVQRLLTIWELVEAYVASFVSASYGSDAAVASDQDLQTWLATSASSDPAAGGNVAGLPETNDRETLQKVLTSLVYRLTVHGISRLSSTSNPALTFVSNFPHCLQRTDIPGPRAKLSTRTLLSYLPNTNTISSAVTFYFTFAFSTPYEPFIPLHGVGRELFFPDGDGDSRNQALIKLRKGLGEFIADYQPDLPQPFQWPRNIET